MATRHVLHRKYLDNFKEWLNNNGWTIEPNKGEWEVLRARKVGRKKPLIIYDRLEGDHFSFMDRDYGVVKAFIRANKSKNMDKE